MLSTYLIECLDPESTLAAFDIEACESHFLIMIVRLEPPQSGLKYLQHNKPSGNKPRAR